MCLIVASQTGKLPTDELVQDAFTDNPDGWGMMYHAGGVIHVQKGMDLASLKTSLVTVKDKPYVLHFRWATHGGVELDNNHPFKVTKKVWMAHNGIIHNISEWRKDRSDSWHFAKELGTIVNRHRDWAVGSDFVPYVEKWIGKSNKIAFLWDDGLIKIANEEQGVTKDGIWYSNDNSFAYNRIDIGFDYGMRQSNAEWMRSWRIGSSKFAYGEDKVKEEEVLELDTPERCEWCSEVTMRMWERENCLVCFDCKRNDDFYTTQKAKNDTVGQMVSNMMSSPKATKDKQTDPTKETSWWERNRAATVSDLHNNWCDRCGAFEESLSNHPNDPTMVVCLKCYVLLLPPKPLQTVSTPSKLVAV
jgi:glutamine amidotransferase class II-like protein